MRMGISKMLKSKKSAFAPCAILVAGSLSILSSTGCQVHVAGQTLPRPYYLTDDVQYFPAGSENKLANETAALKAAREEAKARR
jgi:hypothetical protein